MMKKRLLSLALAILTLISLFIMPVSAVSIPSISSSKYISAYTLNSSGKVYAYTSSSLKTKTGGYIACSTDECRIIKISGNAVQVSYPVSSGRKTAWFYRSSFTSRDLASSGASSSFTATKSATTYRWQGKSTKFGSIAKGDKCYILSGSMSTTWLQVIYPTGTTYKMGWVKSADLSSTSSSGSSTTSAVQARLDKIANGTLTRNSSTVLAVGKTFVGTLASEQCKGYAKNVFYLCFGITPGSTQSKPNNHLLNSTSGMKRVGSVTSMTSANVKSLFSSARPGDFVQMRRTHGGSHSAIVYSVSSTGVTFLEANTDNKNGIYKTTYTWATLCSKNAKMSVYTASNYKLK